MNDMEGNVEPVIGQPNYLHYLAEDGIVSVQGTTEDGAYDAFVHLTGREPDRIIGVLSESGASVEGEIVWENEYEEGRG